MKVNEIGSNPQTYAGEKSSVIKGKEFIKLFNQALGKTSADTGWTDRVEKVPILGTGYKNLDKNADGRVDVEDLKAISPNKAYDLSKTSQVMGKKEQDFGWEDKIKWVRRRRWGGRYYWSPQVTPGYKHSDFNKDKRIDKEDLFTILKDIQSLSFIKEAYGKGKVDVGWMDKTQELLVQGYKNADLTNDGRVTEDDLAFYFNQNTTHHVATNRTIAIT
ncbi:MAG: hypothetical protein AAB267_04530, partial [Candidatus Desantisbacteria bacterium]